MNNFLKAVNSLGSFLSKGRKFYIIAFLNFLSQYFDQEREALFFQSKHESAREIIEFMTAEYIYLGTKQQLRNLLRVAVRLWR